MSSQSLIPEENAQVPPYEAAAMAQGLAMALAQFVGSLLMELDRRLDKRLVRTFLQTLTAMLMLRDRANGLLLSELGGYLESPDKAPAGTKRLSHLLHASKWSAWLIGQFLWQRASRQVAQWQEQGEVALALWDESEYEKPETVASDELSAVRSSKAARLTHIKPGYYTPPGKPIFVPGLHWLAVIVVGLHPHAGPPVVAAMRWWSTRGVHASHKRDEEAKVLVQLAGQWGRAVIHVCDRGYAGALWLGLLLAFQLRFIVRWQHSYRLLDADGNSRLTWHLTRGKKGWDERTLWDSRRGKLVKMSVLAVCVCHPNHPGHPLWLVVARSPGRSPWYLLTSEAVTTAEQAWDVVLAYARRWQIEQTWRYEKSELAVQSPRVWEWEVREKLLLMVTLVYAFLLSLLAVGYEPLRRWLLRHYCHRTGRKQRRVKMPLYRLRSALSRLWLEYRPDFARWASSSRPPEQADGRIVCIRLVEADAA